MSSLPWDQLRGKFCKLVLKDGGKLKVVYGTVVDANSSFIVNKDSKGRIHFVSTSIVERIHEHLELVKRDEHGSQGSNRAV